MTNTRTKYLYKILAIAAAALWLQGCATIFSSRHQKVRFEAATPDASVSFDGNEHKKSVRLRLDKCRGLYTVQATKEGFKTRNHAFELHALARTYPFTLLNILMPFLGTYGFMPLDLKESKVRVFKRRQVIPALLPYDKRSPDEKYMFINKTSIDAKSEDVKLLLYKGLIRYNENNRLPHVKKNGSIATEDVKVDNTIFTDALNYSLLRMDFVDTSRTLFPNVGNSLYLNARVERITFHNVLSRFNNLNSATRNSLISMELEIEWELLDYYKQKIYSTRTKKRSDLFTISSSDAMPVIREAFEDNLEYALIDIRKEVAAKGYLKITEAKADTNSVILLPKPSLMPGARINDFIKSSVTIKVDDGHGTGAIISDSGHIVTNFHVIAGSKKIEVLFSDSTTMEAEVVRVQPGSDLALLKVKKANLQPLLMSENDDPEVGIDVWTIGTPKNLELGQSVSKGVLSAVRKKNGLSYLQTDMSINSGNSGGPLLTREGLLLGVISSKLIGIGTEGVGFAISSGEIFKALNIRYK
ncbi:MAG: trypsin-like peptidase domain-containing protein [Bacteroidota bacterium]